jgi:hypothetical protein
MDYSHYIAKYLCGERFDRYTEEERQLLSDRVDKEEWGTLLPLYSMYIDHAMPNIRQIESFREKLEQLGLSQYKTVIESAKEIDLRLKQERRKELEKMKQETSVSD